MLHPRALALVALTLLLASRASGQARNDPPAPLEERIAWWTDARFGLFIHFGLYSIPAGTWKDETHHGEWIMHTAQIPVEEYETLAASFNPTAFDAEAWVRIAKNAGMKYIVITSKHHDGFCLFDSRHTEYDIMATPFRRDVMAELAEACRREGLGIGWYHSIMDWHHPDYMPRRDWDTRPPDGDFIKYLAHLRRQVRELLTRYGDIDIMWFDGEWEPTWEHRHGQALYELCLRVQPNLIVNNRVDIGRAGMSGFTANEKFAGDFGTPEQEVPATGVPGLAWETCLTTNRHWGYNERDDDWKSAEELVRTLVDVASKGGNLLLNVGPRADGTFPPEAVERLEKIGDWMRVNGAAIYGTTASPFAALPWGRCTVGEGPDGTPRLYLHVFEWPEGPLVVPGVGNRPGRAYLLSAPDQHLFVERDGDDLEVPVPDAPPDSPCPVVVLELHGAPIVYEAPAITAIASVLVKPRAVTLSVRSEDLTIRYTTDGTEPDASSVAYESPLSIGETLVVKARSFHAGRPVSDVAERVFTRVEPSPAAPAKGSKRGLLREEYTGDWDTLPDFDAIPAVHSRPTRMVDLRYPLQSEFAGYRFRGFLNISDADVYEFALTSDDGSRLTIDGTVVIDNDGLHGAQRMHGVMALAAGPHAIVVDYFNKTGNSELELLMAPAGGELAILPGRELTHDP